MDLMEFRHKSCWAHIAEFEDTATIYMIGSSEPGKGHATELLKEAQEYYKGEGKELRGSVALNPTMSHIYRKLGIFEYC